ncbi:MAG: GNAT family N-acetyltransferase [Alphaproteobacteria bacterium]|nr:GNAT family N-acetyltransferase [Alphaproteobacteria bacterium]
MQILEMQQSDLESVTSLAAQLGYPDSLETIKARFAAIGKAEGHRLWVARLPDRGVVGWIHVNRTNQWLIEDPVAEVCSIIVSDSYRREGVGAALLKKAEDWATENGLGIKLYTNAKREKAHRFYEHSGFTLKKVSHVYIKAALKE